MLSDKQGSTTYHYKSLWYDSGFEPPTYECQSGHFNHYAPNPSHNQGMEIITLYRAMSCGLLKQKTNTQRKKTQQALNNAAPQLKMQCPWPVGSSEEVLPQTIYWLVFQIDAKPHIFPNSEEDVLHSLVKPTQPRSARWKHFWLKDSVQEWRSCWNNGPAQGRQLRGECAYV